MSGERKFIFITRNSPNAQGHIYALLRNLRERALGPSQLRGIKYFNYLLRISPSAERGKTIVPTKNVYKKCKQLRSQGLSLAKERPWERGWEVYITSAASDYSSGNSKVTPYLSGIKFIV